MKTLTLFPHRQFRHTAAAVLMAAFVAFALAAPAAAQTPGPPSGNGVQPVWVAGNPDCADLGYAFGFKIDGSPNGTFPLTSGSGTLTGGAPEDPANSVTISNSDGVHFDWSASLGIDAVIVKGGPNANHYPYAPEATSDTGLHAPINASNGNPYGLSHIEFCYDYEVSVAKDAHATFTRTWEWSIEKSVAPASWELFTGDTGTSKYTVAVSKTGFSDGDWAVSGTITIHNGTPFDTTVTSVDDQITGGIAPPVDCGGLPAALAAGDTLECTYATPLPDGAARTNTATVAVAAGPVGGGQAEAAIAFGAPTSEVNDEINVVDTNGMAWGPVGTSMAWMYERTFACDGDEGAHGNVASIVETGQSDDAAVGVTCYGLDVSKDVSTRFDRDWSWEIEKTSDLSELLLSDGQVYAMGYHVSVEATSEDSAWEASGSITVDNQHPSAPAVLVSVSDLVSGGHAAVVDCPSLVVPAGGSLVCTWSVDLPDGADRTNVASALLQNVAVGSDGTVTPTGTTEFASPGVAVVFGDPSQEFDECIDLDDDLYGPLGSVCADQAPTTLDYTQDIGPFSDPEDCGENEVVNVASFVAGDTGATGESSATVVATLECSLGCTLTPGYWKTHSSHGPAPYDDTWAELPGGADTVFFLSGQSWYEVLWTSPKGGNAYYILAHAYAATSLNFLDGASAPPEVVDAWNEATDLFELWTPAQIAALKGNKPPRPRFLELAGLLDMYNNGLLGPGHCSEDDSSGP